MNGFDVIDSLPENEVISMLRHNVIFSDQTTQLKLTVLIYCCLYGKFKIANYLIDYGVNIHKINSVGCNALHYCCNRSGFETAKRLINNGIRINEPITNTPLLCALSQKNAELAEYLVDYGAKVDYCRTISPLFLATKHGYKRIAIKIAKKTMRLEDEAIFNMFRNGWEDIIIMIINRGFNCAIRDIDGSDIFDYSQTYKMPRVSKIVAIRSNNSLARYFMRHIMTIHLNKHFYKDVNKIIVSYIRSN